MSSPAKHSDWKRAVYWREHHLELKITELYYIHVYFEASFWILLMIIKVIINLLTDRKDREASKNMEKA